MKRELRQPDEIAPPARTLPLWQGRSLALLGIALVALNLRIAVTAISPIVEEISTDVPLGNFELSFLGMLPAIAFALAGVFGAAIARRFGLERFLIVAIVAIIVGHLWRAMANDYVVLFAGSVVVLLGMGAGNVLIPPLVKRYFPDRIGLVTAIYVTLMTVGVSLPGVLAVPVAAAGWRLSLGMWASVALLSLLPWLGVLLQHRRERAAQADALVPPVPATLAGGMWRSRTAWAIAGVFFVAAFNAMSMFAWLPVILMDIAGQTATEAGILVAYYGALGIPASLIAPLIAAKMRNIGPLIWLGALLLAAGNLGLMFSPADGTWLWVTCTGAGQVVFPISLLLINSRSRTPLGSVTLSSFVQGISFSTGAFGPLLVGLIIEWTGNWQGVFAMLCVSALVAAFSGYVLRKPSFVEDELHLGGSRRLTD